MIPNAINTILGIWLVYAILLDPDSIESPWRVTVSAIIIFVMELWARRTDYSPWQSRTNMVLAVFLLLIALLKFFSYTYLLVNYWGVFWIGILVAVLALWAEIYHPKSPAK